MLQPIPARPHAHSPQRLRAWVGQTTTEFMLIAAVVALVSLPSMMFLQQMQRSFYEMHQASMNQSVSDAATTLSVPTDQEQCLNSRWIYFTDDNGTRFRNQGDCISWVVTNGANEADGGE